MNPTDPDQTGETLQEIMKAQLARRFPYKDSLGPDELAYEEGETIREADVDADLAQHLPSYKFFQTRLTTCYDQYPFVDIIAAINMDDQKEVRVLTSPVFRPDSPEFFELFYGLPAPEGPGREALIMGIARLLESITHEGSLEIMEADNNRSKVNLYREYVSQNVLIFEFDESGRLVAIRVNKGSGRR